MKTVEEIYEEMRAAFYERTGHEAGLTGDLAVRLYAVAAQVHALYIQGEWVARQCFPQSALGEYLDRHAQLRGLVRRGAEKARGVLRFQVETAVGADLAIPAGTVCMTAAQVRFETTKEAILVAGETAVEVPAQALESGTSGNVAANTVLAMAVVPVGISRCGNPAAFFGGTDEENDQELRQRVLETFRRMPNGANAAFYEQEVMSFPQVAATVVLPRNRGAGTVDIVVSTAEGLPDAALLETLRAHLEKKREIAVDVVVKAPTVQMVDVNVAVTPAEGYTQQAAQAATKAAVEGWFDGTRLGKNVLRAELSGLIFAAAAVGNCMVTAPAADVVLQASEMPKLGTVTVVPMGDEP